MCIVVQLPPPGGPTANGTLYRVAIIGQGYHGLLVSPTTHIPASSRSSTSRRPLLGRPRPRSRWSRRTNAVGQLRLLGQRSTPTTGSSSRRSSSSPGSCSLSALLGVRAAVTAVPAALLVNLALGVAQVSNEVLLVAAVSAGTALLAFGLARLCRSDDALLALYGGVVALYAAAMVTHPEWQAVNPFGPTQNSRFWGIGNQIETLLLVPLLAGAVLARRRFGIVGFLLFGIFGLVVVTDNRIGADGGGAIVLGVALAVLGSRLFRLGRGLHRPPRGGGVRRALDRLARPRRNRVRTTCAARSRDSGAGLLSSLASRVPLSYLPALHAWQLVVPLLFVLAAAFALAWRDARVQSTRDVLLAFGVALVTSLLVNDSAAYELAGGSPSSARWRGSLLLPRRARADRVLAPEFSPPLKHAKLGPEPVPVPVPTELRRAAPHTLWPRRRSLMLHSSRVGHQRGEEGTWPGSSFTAYRRCTRTGPGRSPTRDRHPGREFSFWWARPVRQDDRAEDGRRSGRHHPRRDLDRRSRGELRLAEASGTSRWSSRTTRCTRT